MVNMNSRLDYLPALKKEWKNEIITGFTIFLIALPLCIGIALASGAPPTAGLLAGIVGGMIVSLFSSTKLAINGPAAGLIVIVLASVEEMGKGDNLLGFRYTLYAVFIAGLIQILLGYLRAGIIALLLPIDIIHGMLCGIGFIIFAKQIHPAFGVIPEAKDIIGLILEIPRTIQNANPYVALISFVSAVILISTFKLKRLRKIPASLLVVLTGIVLGQIFSFETPHTYYLFGNEYVITPKLLIQIPENFFDGIIFPDFSIWSNPKIYVHAFTIAIVGSVESLLTSAAVDNISSDKQKSNMNQELVAKGIGNTILGLIGEIPIIAEVVRSSANISSGAKTRWSNFFHGLFLFIFAAFFPYLIHLIPVSALASLLVFVGLRISLPEIKHILKEGADHTFVFFVTAYFVVSHDLLLGVGIGLVAKLALHIVNTFLPEGVCFNDFFHVQFHKDSENEENIKYKIYGILVYTNLLSFKFQIDNIPKTQHVTLEMENLRLIDRTFLNFLKEIQSEFLTYGGKLEIVGLDRLRPMSEFEGSGRKRQF